MSHDTLTKILLHRERWHRDQSQSWELRHPRVHVWLEIMLSAWQGRPDSRLNSWKIKFFQSMLRSIKTIQWPAGTIGDLFLAQTCLKWSSDGVCNCFRIPQPLSWSLFFPQGHLKLSQVKLLQSKVTVFATEMNFFHPLAFLRLPHQSLDPNKTLRCSTSRTELEPKPKRNLEVEKIQSTRVRFQPSTARLEN